MNIEQLACSTNQPGNTGFDPSCYLDIQNIIGMALAPVDLVIAAGSLTADTIIPYLKTQALLDNAFSRVYPVNGFIGITTAGGDLRSFTTPYGAVATTGENDYAWTFQFTAGGAQLLSQLRRFNSNGQWGLILWDKNNIYMLNNGDGTASPFPTTTTWGLPLTLNNGQDPTLYSFLVGMTATVFNDQRFALHYNGSINSVRGIRDVVLTSVNWNEATGVANVKLTSGVSNLEKSIGSPLANVAAWKASNGATGGVIPVLSVTLNDGLGTYTVTLTISDPDYPAAVGTIVLDLVGPTELAALTPPVVGFQSVAPLTLVTS